ncbi:ParA family protein [Lysinibacillus sphaericus]|uniref:ParA family protein n=1 Tax=Lysinibacillus sphaericus TaxID=1421 RepID=UPI001CC14B47|nr:ParA family protein [Lysinibacillus sphaericus]
MKIITFFNNKGGVGKTTLGVNIAAYFSIEMKKRVLVLDGDPQANTTQMMVPEENWQELYEDEYKSIHTLHDYFTPLLQGEPGFHPGNFTMFSKENNRFKVDLIPGDPRISVIEDIFSEAWNKSSSGKIEGFRKSNWLNIIKEHYKDNYDVMFVDVGPSLGALNRSILLNSDYIITPMGSDIFSLMAIKNISSWIDGWKEEYNNGVVMMQKSTAPYSHFPIKLDASPSSSLLGYSIQQYITKTIKKERRPIKSYETIIKEIPQVIDESLKSLIPSKLDSEMLNLGSVPYLYSLVPLAQTSNSPIFELKGSDGVAGVQYSHVENYKSIITSICEKISNNMETLTNDD